MKNIKAIIFLLLFILFMSGAYAQNVTGVVYTYNEQNNKEPLPGVNLYWKGTQTGTVSDPDGNFSIALPAMKSPTVAKAMMTVKTVWIACRGELGFFFSILYMMYS